MLDERRLAFSRTGLEVLRELIYLFLDNPDDFKVKSNKKGIMKPVRTFEHHSCNKEG